MSLVSETTRVTYVALHFHIPLHIFIKDLSMNENIKCYILLLVIGQLN